MANEVELVLSARDEALAALESFGQAAGRLSQNLRRMTQDQQEGDRQTSASTQALVAYDQGLRRAGTAVRALALPLTAELSPALGGTSARIASVLTSAAAMGTGFGAVAIAATGLASVLTGHLVGAWQRAREEQERYRQAMNSMDPGPFTKLLAEQSEQLRVLAQEYKALQDLRKEAEAREQRAGVGTLGGAIQRGRESQTDQKVKELEAKILALDAEIRMRRQALVELELERQADTAWQRAASRPDELTLAHRAADRGLSDYRLDPVETEFRQAQREAEERRRAGDAEGAARLERAAAERRQYRLAEQTRLREAERRRELDLAAVADYGDEGLAYARPTATELLQITQAGQAAVERLVAQAAEARDLRAPLPIDTEDEAIAWGRHSAADLAMVREAGGRAAERQQAEVVELQREGVRLEQERLELLAQVPGLSERERDALQVVVDAERERLRLAEADLAIQAAKTDEERRLAEMRKQNVQLDETMRRAIRAQARAERDIGEVGLLKGLTDAENEMGAAGRRMEALARQTAEGMARSYGDGFFAVITGDFRRLPDIARQSAMSMLRVFTDELGRMATAPILGALRSAMAGPGGSWSTLAPVATMSALPAGASAGAGVAQGLVPGAPASGVQLAGLPLGLPTAGLGTLLSAPFGGLYTPPIILNADAAALGWAAAEGAGFGIVPGFGAVAPDAAAAGWAAAEGAPGVIGPMGASMGWMQGLGMAGSAVGLGLSSYAAYQAGSPLTGFLGGALYGAMFGSYFGPWGTAIGAVAGALIGAGAGAAGKGRGAGAERRQARHERAQAILQEFRAVLDSNPPTLEAARERLAQPERWSGARLGDLLMIMANGLWIPDTGIQMQPRPELAARLASGGFEVVGQIGNFGHGIGSVTELIAVSATGTGDDAADGVRVWEQLLDEFERGMDALLTQEASVLFQYQEALGGAGAGITRTTLLPYSRRGAAPPGSQLALAQETILGLDDEVKIALLQELARLDHDRDLQIIYRDEDAGRVVRSSTHTYTPPPAPPPPPAPEVPTVEPIFDPGPALATP